MLFHRTLTYTLLLSSTAAFNVAPSGDGTKISSTASNNKFAKVLAAGVISAASLLPLATPAVAAESRIIGTPLETQLANFGAASYPVFNSITDASPLVDKLLAFVDKKVKAPDAAKLAQTAVDGLLAIPDSKITAYSNVLKTDVYGSVSKSTCVSLGGSEAALQKISASAAVQSVDKSKMDALAKKFKPANSAVPLKGGNICLPGSASASEKLWVAQAELTASMPKAQATALVASIKTVGAQATRPAIAALVPGATEVFSKSPEAIKMVAAGKAVEPSVIAATAAALK